MSTNKNLTKKLILSISAIVMFILANIGIMKLEDKVQVSAANETSNLTITNSEFASNKNQSYPYTSPSGFTAYAYNQEMQSGLKNEKCGVIDLSDEEYSNRFKDALNFSSDNYCLMLTSDDSNLHFGYRTNDLITLSANSNYIFSVMAYTETSSQIGSIALYDEDGKLYTELNNISSNRVWTPYNLVVSTGSKEVKVKLGLNIKGKGTILFDSISAMQVSSNYLKTTAENAAKLPNNYKFRSDLNLESIDNVYVVENERFIENTVDLNGKLTATAKSFSISGISNSTIDSTMAVESSGFYNSSILVNHEKENYSAFATEENFLTIEQNRIYKVTVTAKAEDLSGEASLKLIQTNLEKDETAESLEIKISSNTTSSVNNNYKNYNFYIVGHPEKDTTFKFTFALGSQETKATGKLYISGITKSKINYADYNDASSTDAQKLNLNSKVIYTDSKIYLNNANFNAMQITEYNKPYPATPDNWTVSAGKDKQYYGVVNTQYDEFAKLTEVLKNISNPYSSEINQNVLFMYNASNESLSYTSDSKDLSANTIHKFEVKVQAQNAPIKVSLVTTKNDQEIELVSKSIQTGVQNWQNVELLVKTGFESLNVSLKLTLDCTNLPAYAYIDDAKFDYLTAPTQNDFDMALNKVDLKNILANENMFECPENESVETKFLNVNADNISNYVIDEEAFNTLATDNVMLIKAYEDTFYTVKTKLGINLTQDKVYKISVSVYTQKISTNDEESDLTKLGATIKLSSFEESFTSIVSDGAWKTYTFYVKPNSSTTSTTIEISIGSEEVMAKGDIFFGNIQVWTNSQDTFGAENYDSNLDYEFEVLSERENIKILNTVKEETVETDEEESKEETKESTKLDKQTILYLIPSIIFAIAIVLAVVCTLVRKIKWKKPTKKNKKSDYDRTKTINKQVYARRAAVLRETKLRELKKKLEDLSNERNKYEEEYKLTLSKIRELKLKRADKTEIAKLEKDLKKNQKASAVIGLSVNKVNRELEYAKTEPYLQALIKRLHQEKLENYNPDENE